jgi:MT0933-like antitoxin protein
MGIFDKAKDLAADHLGAVDKGIDQVGEFADAKTGHKYSEQIDQGEEQAKLRAADYLKRPEQ